MLALAQRYGAAAAVNGGYFLYKPYDGAAAGNLMIKGQVLGTGAPDPPSSSAKSKTM